MVVLSSDGCGSFETCSIVMVLFLDLGVFESFETSPNDKDLIVEGLMEVLGKSFCFEGLKVSFTAS